MLRDQLPNFALSIDAMDIDAAKRLTLCIAPRGVHRCARVCSHAPRIRLSKQRCVVRCVTKVHHGPHGEPRFCRRERGQPGLIIPREHHQLSSWRHRVMIEQSLQRTTKHHTRQVVVAKDHMLLTAPRCQHTTFRAHLEQAIALNHGQVMIGEPAITERISEHSDAGMRGNVGDERLRLASYRRVVDGEPVIGQGAA